MSTLPPSSPAPPTAARRGSVWGYVWKVGGSLLLLFLVSVGLLVFYASTARFSNLLRQKVIVILEDATGGLPVLGAVIVAGHAVFLHGIDVREHRWTIIGQTGVRNSIQQKCILVRPRSINGNVSLRNDIDRSIVE